MRVSCFSLVLLGVSLLVGHSLEWQQGQGYRFADLKIGSSGKAGFTQMAPGSTGIHFTNFIAELKFRTNQILLNGSGVAAGDVDGDGLCDLYVCSLDRPNVLYRNLGNWKFEDITERAGVACPDTDASGSVLVDLDGDADLDLVVNSVGHGTRLFFNDGKGRFEDRTKASPLNPGRGATSVAAGDLNGDGFLDLYIANYRRSALMDMPNTRFTFKKLDGKQVVATVAGRPVTDPEFLDRFIINAQGGIEEQGEADLLLINQGGTNFIQKSFTDGSFLDEEGKPYTTNFFDWGLSVVIRDINQDGLADIFICNDFDSLDRIWLNRGGGKFQAPPKLTLRKTSLFSMGVDFADINRDGWDDFCVLDMLSPDRIHRLTTAGDRKPPIPVIGEIDNRPGYMMNTLFLNRGNGSYAEIGQLAGLAATDWAWAVVFLDIDLDGWEDVLISNGHERAARHLDVIEQLKINRAQRAMTPAEILEARNLFPRLATPNAAFRNQRDLTFKDMSASWGFNFTGVSHGIACADLDDDGDLDVVVNNLNDPISVYRNEAAARRIAVRLKGKAPNTAGIGARITVSGGPITQSQEVIAGGRYLSSDDAMRVFAAGESSTHIIRVDWPDGTQSVVKDAKANRVYLIEQSGAAKKASTRETERPPEQFKDVSELLSHQHIEQPFDDYARQPLLPNKLSQGGPGITWTDLDSDGWVDLIIGTGKGGPLACYRNDKGKAFTKIAGAPFDAPVPRDETAILPMPHGNGKKLLAGAANYEDGVTIASSVRSYSLTDKKLEDAWTGTLSSVGPMVTADVDGNGTLDVFIGGRTVAGRYPQPASSALLLNRGNDFVPDVANSNVFANLGMVSGAVFTDYDADGDPDLALALEWGPIKLFRNASGKFTDVTESSGLLYYKGWWNGITAGDFDGDGKLDLAASNWGMNSPYQLHRSQPLKMHYGDLMGIGGTEFIESHYDGKLGKRVPQRGLAFMARTFRFLPIDYPTHTAYASSSIEQLFGERLKKAAVLEANWLETSVFLNRGGRFEAKPLPPLAQAAPAFGIAVADFNGDGFEDIVLSQNFFACQAETPRYDAGTGLLLIGNGKGEFTALTNALGAFGEQRGCAVGDFNADGRADVCIGQNGAATKLYANVSATPGLRIRLIGSASNPDGIGAVIRLVADSKSSPAREIHGGSGYWSVDSPLQVLAGQNPQELLVRWPGGNETRTKLSGGLREVAVDITGKIISSVKAD